MEGSSQSAKPNAGSSIKKNIELTGRALQTLITKTADIVDSNPAKVALGLVKAIIEISNVRHRFSHRILTDYYSRL
jgi:energy-converting hydrogenase Eha subunit B